MASSFSLCCVSIAVAPSILRPSSRLVSATSAWMRCKIGRIASVGSAMGALTIAVPAYHFHDGSHQHRGRALEILFDSADEDRAERAVDGAVIARQGDLHLRRDRDLAVLDDDALVAGAERQD